MPRGRKPKFQIASPAILRHFDQMGKRVFNVQEIARILDEQRGRLAVGGQHKTGQIHYAAVFRLRSGHCLSNRYGLHGFRARGGIGRATYSNAYARSGGPPQFRAPTDMSRRTAKPIRSPDRHPDFLGPVGTHADSSTIFRA